MFRQTYYNMNQILEENGNILWLGDWRAATNRNEIDKQNIKTVLTVASALNVEYQDQTIVHKVYQILDSETSNIHKLFEDTYKQITEGLKRGSVLVHCAAGISRSSTIVIAYIMKKNNLNFIEAKQFVKNKRGVIQPNMGFERQLKNFEKELKTQKIIPDQSKKSENIDKMPLIQDKKISTTTVQLNDQDQGIIKQLNLQPLQNPFRPINTSNNVKKQEPQQSKIGFFNSSFQNKYFSSHFTNNGRSSSTQTNKINMQTTYNSSYAGPQIITHSVNKLYESKPGNDKFSAQKSFNVSYTRKF